MKKWILDKWKDGQTDYSLCVICKKKGFKRTWLKFAGHISGSECFREIKRGHVIYNIHMYCIHLVLTASRSNCYFRNPRDDFLFLVLLSTKHSNSCLWTPNDLQHGMIVRRNLTLFSQESWFNSTSNFNIQYCQAYTQVQINQ